MTGKPNCACGCGQPAGLARNGRPSRYASYECADIAAKRRTMHRKNAKAKADRASRRTDNKEGTTP